MSTGGPKSRGTIGIYAHRLACWLMDGDPQTLVTVQVEKPPPGARQVACHGCHNPACVRLACLRWRSDADNLAQSQQHDGHWCALFWRVITFVLHRDRAVQAQQRLWRVALLSQHLGVFLQHLVSIRSLQLWHEIGHC